MKKTVRWVVVFLIIFLLTQDYFFFDWETQPGWLGLPNWLGWFIGIHLLLVLEFLRFQKKYWE